MKINANQLAVLRHLAGLEKYSGQSNHFINAKDALVRRGLARHVAEVQNGLTVYKVVVTELGHALLSEVKPAA